MNSGGGNLLELYALAKGEDLDRAVEELASVLSVPLERRSADEAPAAVFSEDFHYVEVGHFVRTDEENAALEPGLVTYDGQEGRGRGVISCFRYGPARLHRCRCVHGFTPGMGCRPC